MVDVDSGVGASSLAHAAAALHRQVIEHYAPRWGAMAEIRAAIAGGAQPRPHEWRLELRRVPIVDGALGYHDETEFGVPTLYVFPELCEQDGTSWTSCASHEILEALTDPLLNFCAQSPLDGRVYALEVCDAVETDIYKIDGVEVSNFVTPEYFSPPKHLAGVVLDHMQLLKAPYEIRPGGYMQYLDRHGWHQLGARRPYRSRVAEIGLHRHRGGRRKVILASGATATAAAPAV